MDRKRFFVSTVYGDGPPPDTWYRVFDERKEIEPSKPLRNRADAERLAAQLNTEHDPPPSLDKRWWKVAGNSVIGGIIAVVAVIGFAAVPFVFVFILSGGSLGGDEDYVDTGGSREDYYTVDEIVLPAPGDSPGGVDCGNFSTHRQAQAFYESNNPARDPFVLDADRDGIACEWLP